ncbi:hypothetical protein F5884DRAFT_855763 [Xylogone sp. PMI_703]|nr:hypothetical protein F5884DRAFT_855763 [Xylogone sp. PMI_703]
MATFSTLIVRYVRTWATSLGSKRENGQLDESHENLLSGGDLKDELRPSSLVVWPWKLATGILLTLLLWSSYTLHSAGYENGFITHLKPARRSIAIDQVKFTGGLKWSNDGVLYRDQNGGEAQYVGKPSPEIDAAWYLLLKPHFIDLDKKPNTVVDTYQNLEGEYLTGLDVFHQLHCLNRIRQRLSPDYYKDPNSPEVQQLHTDHCIDSIRQSIMCFGDMTPIPLQYNAVVDKLVPEFETTHTCRSFQALWDYSNKRDFNRTRLPENLRDQNTRPA